MSAAPGSEPSFRESVDLMFARAVALMDLPPGLADKIKVCNATYTVRFGVRLRGDIHTFTGYRSVHSEHMEPVKGGIRFATGVNQDEVEALAALIMGLPKQCSCSATLAYFPQLTRKLVKTWQIIDARALNCPDCPDSRPKFGAGFDAIADELETISPNLWH